MSRLIAQLAVATRTSPREWDLMLDADPRMLATVVDIMSGQRAAP